MRKTPYSVRLSLISVLLNVHAAFLPFDSAFSSSLLMTEKDNYRVWRMKPKAALLDKRMPQWNFSCWTAWTGTHAGSQFRKDPQWQLYPQSFLSLISTSREEYLRYKHILGTQTFQSENDRSVFSKNKGLQLYKCGSTYCHCVSMGAVRPSSAIHFWRANNCKPSL